MGIFTDILKLFKTNMATDGDDFFDFDRDLNQNWDKIDEFAQEEELTGVYFDKLRDINVPVPGSGTQSIDIDYYETGDIGD